MMVLTGTDWQWVERVELVALVELVELVTPWKEIRMNRTPLRALLAAGTLVMACSAVAQNIAVVNNKPIPKSRADEIINQLASQGQANSPELQKAVREELINREILMQEADKKGLLGRRDVQAQIERVRQQVLIGALAQEYFRTNPPSDAEMRAQYENLNKSMGGREYNTRHILVDSEGEARGIIAKLKGGAKFEDLAKVSKDPSGANGGSLGWGKPETYVQPFSEAMVKLGPGKLTDNPVRTQFGFHVIRVDEVRDARAPSFEESKGRILEAMMQNQQWQQAKFKAMIDDLRARAKVE